MSWVHERVPPHVLDGLTRAARYHHVTHIRDVPAALRLVAASAPS
jgi:hypothetical protein